MKTTPQSAFKNGFSRQDREQNDRAGFTFTELLVVIAVIGMLALMILPTLARTSPNSNAAQCMNNLRQLTTAWRMYADDNKDLLVASLALAGTTYNGRPVWMTGILNVGGVNPSRYDINTDVVKSPLWNYCGQNASLFRCPADLSSVTVGGKVYPRVRSYSMSQVFDFGEWLPASNWRTYAKMSDIMKPNHTFVFIDENPAWINDAAFATDCNGLPGSGTSGPQIVDLPTISHNKAGGLSFADGHIEMHKWKGRLILTAPGTIPTNADDLDDFVYLASNTTVRK